MNKKKLRASTITLICIKGKIIMYQQQNGKKVKIKTDYSNLDINPLKKKT